MGLEFGKRSGRKLLPLREPLLEQESSLNKHVMVKTLLGKAINDHKLSDKPSDGVLLKTREAQSHDPSQ